MNISANSNTLDSELEYANVDMRKTLEPFGLEMWPGATNGKDFDLRKYSFGVASVLLGTALFAAHSAQADEVGTPTVSVGNSKYSVAGEKFK